MPVTIVGAGLEHSDVNTAAGAAVIIKTGPCSYYGGIVINRTTAGVTVVVCDAVASGITATNVVDCIKVAAGTYANNGSMYIPCGVAMHNGIVLNAITMTAASDHVIVFYGP